MAERAERTLAERLERHFFGRRYPRNRRFNTMATVGRPITIHDSRPRTKGETTQRLIGLVESNQVCSQTSAAQLLGVSRQRVSQIVEAEGLYLGQQQKNTLISWPCPDCGIPVEMWTGVRNNRDTAYCHACKARNRDRPVPVDVVCSVTRCRRPGFRWGLCAGHHARSKKQGHDFDTGPINEYPRRHSGCTEAGCPNGHYAKGLCRNHYARAHTGAAWRAAHA